MSMILSWVLFPLVLGAVGLGWGALLGWAAGERDLGALAIPIGVAGAIVVAAILTAFEPTAQAAAPVVAAGALAGLARAWRRASIPVPAILAAIGVVAIYGAPVIFSGQDTFLGYIRLDDTAQWLGFIDQFFSHGRSLASLPSSTYSLVLYANLTVSGYPSGAFMLPGIGHWITGIDVAWIFQPDMAVCAGALSLCCYDLITPVIESRWLRAFVCFIAAQSALLFGYAAWGGIKELTIAFLLALVMAAAARLLAREVRAEPLLGAARATIPLAVSAAALIVTIGVGAGVYLLPAALVLLIALLSRGQRGLRQLGGYLAALPLTAALMLPTWLLLHQSVASTNGFVPSASAASHETLFGNLTSPLRAIQLAGVWLDGDFRTFPNPPPSLINHVLVYLVFAAALFGLGWMAWRRRPGPILYVGVALAVLAFLSLKGTVPWIMGKSLAFSSPAVLLAGMAGAAILFSRENRLALAVGIVALGGITGGVIWSNYLQYHNVTLAPRARLSELQAIAPLAAREPPTFINEYEIYADRHFLRASAPIEPAEYRGPALPTLGNAILTDSAWADIDAFGLETLRPYRSLVVRVAPTLSRPPSIYGRSPVWSGRYYQLWQQPLHPSERVLEHVPLGDVTTDAYCGNTQNVTPAEQANCPVQPAAVPPCKEVRSLATTAAGEHADLLAFERTNPYVVRATQSVYSPPQWYISGADLSPALTGATATAKITLTHAVHDYRVWLGGSFQRGFDVSLDGRPIGSISDALDPPGAYEQVGPALDLAAGTHTITVTYPSEGLGPGSADTEAYYTELFAIALAPPIGQGSYLQATPAHAAATLCGRTLDWLEIVAPQ